MDMNHLPPINTKKYGDNVPLRHGKIAAKVGKRLLSITGWQLVGEVPNVKKCVLLAVPHTSNYDGLYAIFALLGLDIDIKLMGKKELFKLPVMGSFLRWAGLISVDRQKKGSTLQATVERFKKQDHLWLGLSPEGTREYTEAWKTGFYHMAVGAGVPILPVAMDYKTRQIRFMPLFYPIGNIEQDLPKIFDYYQEVEGKYFEKMSKPLQDLHKK